MVSLLLAESFLRVVTFSAIFANNIEKIYFRMSEEKLEVKESDMEEAEQATVITVVREAQRLYNVDKVSQCSTFI